jgi:TetR/AcrR family acrAB operon transcriptional repressor
MRRTKEEAEATRRQLMDVALKVFSTRGYAAARLSDIAAEAGVTRGAVYWHFKNKQGLFFAILTEMANPFVQTATEVLGSDLEPGHKIRELIRRVKDATDNSETFLDQREVAIRFMAEHPHGFEEFHRHIFRDMESLTKRITDTIRDAQRSGQIRDDIDASIMTGLIGAALRGSAMGKAVDGMDLLPRGTSEAMVDLLMRGLETR